MFNMIIMVFGFRFCRTQVIELCSGLRSCENSGWSFPPDFDYETISWLTCFLDMNFLNVNKARTISRLIQFAAQRTSPCIPTQTSALDHACQVSGWSRVYVTKRHVLFSGKNIAHSKMSIFNLLCFYGTLYLISTFCNTINAYNVQWWNLQRMLWGVSWENRSSQPVLKDGILEVITLKRKHSSATLRFVACVKPSNCNISFSCVCSQM